MTDKVILGYKASLYDVSKYLELHKTLCLKKKQNPTLMVRTCNPSTPEVVEAGGSRIQGHPQVHSKFEASMGYKRPKKEKRKGGREKGRSHASLQQAD